MCHLVAPTDLARLYHVETKRINEAVKNNPEKFPNRYSFVLTDEDKNNLWSKFSTANISNMSRVNPRVFTKLAKKYNKSNAQIILR